MKQTDISYYTTIIAKWTLGQRGATFVFDHFDIVFEIFKYVSYP